MVAARVTLMRMHDVPLENVSYGIAISMSSGVVGNIQLPSSMFFGTYPSDEYICVLLPYTCTCSNLMVYILWKLLV